MQMYSQFPFPAEKTNKKLGIQTLMGIFLLAFLISTDLSARSLPDSDSYNQCVVESMKGVTSHRAAEGTIRACREKFAGTQLFGADLPPDALRKLIVHAGFGYGIFSGSIYNGNKEYAVTQITVFLTPMWEKKSAEASVEGKEYNIDLSVQPFSKSALSMPILSDSTQEYLWKMTKARGYKTR